MTRRATEQYRDGGLYYNRLAPRRLIEQARPEMRPIYGTTDQAHFVWWCCGGANWGLDPDRGVIPVSVVNRMPTGTVANPPGCGGRWYATETEALDALREAMEKTTEQFIQ
jgi:hypothetical protein